MHVDGSDIEPSQRCHRLDDRELADTSRDGWISEYSYACHTRSYLFEQLQPLCAQAIFELKKTSDISTRLRQTFDETGADWIDDLIENDRCGRRRLQQWLDRRIPGRNDHIRRERDQLLSVSTNCRGIASSPLCFKLQVPPFNPTQLP